MQCVIFTSDTISSWLIIRSLFTLDSVGQQLEMNAPAGEDGWVVMKQKHYLQVICPSTSPCDVTPI
jgi:hypothetical protein